MAILLLAFVFGIMTAVAIPSPDFPVSWIANEEDTLAVTQGPYINDPQGYMCCDPKTNCEVQTEYSNGMTYYDGVNNRTRSDGGGQIIVTLYGDVQKEMLVDSNLVCQEFCPTLGDFDLTPFWPDSVADQKTIKNLGNVTVKGVTAVHYQWVETIFVVVKMQLTDLYVHYNDSGVAVPVWEHDIIEPFGQQLGTEDSVWTGFQATQPDPSLFAVTGISSCKESGNCDSVKLQMNRLRRRDFKTFLKYQQKK